jgi:hypothetical protein
VGNVLRQPGCRSLPVLLGHLRLRRHQRERTGWERIADCERVGLGTITVLRVTSAHDDNQVNYFASGYDQRTGQPISARPNGGSFFGVRYRTGPGADDVQVAWLRSWPHSQRYLSGDTPIVVTTTTAPRSIGLTVTTIDLATPGPLRALDPALAGGGPDVVEREVVVTRRPGSPVVSASLVAYGNFSPIASEIPYVPFEDSGCLTQANPVKVGSYDRTDQVASVSWAGVDLLTGAPATAAIAVGFDGRTSAYEIGTDSQDPLALPGPADGYEELAHAPYRLGRSDVAVGQVTVTLEHRLVFEPNGVATARLVVAAAPNAADATAQVIATRRTSFSSALASVEAAWRSLLGHVPLPHTADARVVDVAERSVITMLLAVDPRTGAIVASSDTQGPYGEDWVRDGSFINAALDLDGFSAIATRHDLFYARTQSQPIHPLPGSCSGTGR